MHLKATLQSLTCYENTKMLKFLCLLLILQFKENFGSTKDDLPEVNTPLGDLRGFWMESVNGKKFAAFEGIPYAKPPIGDLRFEEAQPVNPWPGVWEANNPHTCLQQELLNYKNIIGKEDCLYLNVYVPAEFLNTNKKLVVVVASHGGAFMMGSGHDGFDSRTMMDRDIILVSINYRLGIFGFLSTEDAAIPGNNGMKDQSLALKWVKDNIRSFGGNPHSVTITGLSAGGACVHLHYFSPLSKGLFHRGMAQSGTALAPWAIRNNAVQRAKKLAVLVGCPTSSTLEMKKCLKQRPAYNLQEQVRHFYHIENLPIPLSPFAPVVERKSSKAFLSNEPYLLLKEGKINDLPIIASFAADDGLLPSAFFLLESFTLDLLNENWKNLSRFVLDYNDSLPNPSKDHVVDNISECYLRSGENINQKNFKKFTKACTDRLFASPAEMSAKMQAKATKSPVYFYVFNYQGEQGLVKFLLQLEELEGVGHGDDVIYFYGLKGIQKPLNRQDTQMKYACQDMLYSYATTGVPSFDGTDSWQPTGSTELTYLNITGPNNMKIHTVETLAPIPFWTKLGLKENEYFVRNKDEL